MKIRLRLYNYIISLNKITCNVKSEQQDMQKQFSTYSGELIKK